MGVAILVSHKKHILNKPSTYFVFNLQQKYTKTIRMKTATTLAFLVLALSAVSNALFWYPPPYAYGYGRPTFGPSIGLTPVAGPYGGVSLRPTVGLNFGVTLRKDGEPKRKRVIDHIVDFITGNKDKRR